MKSTNWNHSKRKW